MKINLSLVTIVLLVGFSCTNETSKELQTVTIEDLMGEVEEVNLSEEVVEIDETQIISDGSNLSNLMATLQTKFDTFNLKQTNKLDRFGFSSAKKILFIDKTDKSSPSAEVYEYNYTDSLKLNNAFYNWLDCFGDECLALNINENTKINKGNPSFTVVYDTTIVSIKYSCEHLKTNWKPFQDSILKYYGVDYKYVIKSNCKGKLIWE